MLCPEVLLVSGDFNFHLDDPGDADARKVMELMDTFGLLQHITTPMHVSGHILDLIISRSSNDINVFPPKSKYFISDHCFTECQLSIPGPNMLVKEVSYRKFKQIDMDNFRSDIASSVLCNSQWTSLEELAQCYDTTLSQILDKHAPVNTWFSLELKKLKISRRKLEKKMLKSRSYREVCNNYSMSLKNAKQRYYTLISLKNVVAIQENCFKLYDPCVINPTPSP